MFARRTRKLQEAVVTQEFAADFGILIQDDDTVIIRFRGEDPDAVLEVRMARGEYANLVLDGAKSDPELKKIADRMADFYGMGF